MNATRAESRDLLHNLQKQSEQFKLLYEASQELGCTLDLSKLYMTLSASLKKFMDCNSLFISSYDPRDALIRCVYAIDEQKLLDVSEYPPIPLEPEGHGTQSQVIRTGKPWLLNDYQAQMKSSQAAYYIDDDGKIVMPSAVPEDAILTRSALILPILLEGRVVGVIQVYSYRLNAYSQDDLKVAQALASQFAVASNNALLYQQAQAEIAERERAEQSERAQRQRLQESQARLVQAEKMSALGRLTASIAHEVNNPLQAVQSCLSLCKEGLEEVGNVELVRDLDIAGAEVERIVAIVRRLREFSHPVQDDVMRLEIQPVLETILALMSKQLAQCKVTLERAWTRDLPPVLGNQNQLKQVFLNLVINAIEAMPEGGTLSIATDLDYLTDTYAGRVPAVRIVFCDTGSGIPPEVAVHIFEPFFTTKEIGTGLGLAISYEIVQAFGGEITFASKSGAGTTFTVRLPLAQEQS